ncbi:putative amino acid permease [Aspergillus fijiensis CBS 313.89]|uniref:Putative amino acid permease n=1 Tax=Aspergillus fijiensis CBS 313.89 TaxID=1448319 RepID=A0A8G1RHH4_9EURO|nr:putative amino acid permease [Aspergillus fijiensis CBS 313.89]RAK72492.1 putative amino acid permease [Aspergillus fijiensis CBS 313.89]
MNTKVTQKIAHAALAEGDNVVDPGELLDIPNVHFFGVEYEPELPRNRSLWTLLFQSLAISAIPVGFGSPLISAIYGGGQLSMFLGWVVVAICQQCVAISLAELISRFPVSGGPYFWSFQLASLKRRKAVAFSTGWIWLTGNWTITLAVNFGFAQLVSAAGSLYRSNFLSEPWQLLLVFYGICLTTFLVCSFGNRYLPIIDTICAVFTVIAILVTLICLSIKAKAGRHSVADTLGYYDSTLSGWGDFSFWIGTLPSAYALCTTGMISSMAEECDDPQVKLPRALCLSIPVGGLAGLFYILPICATLPPLNDIIAGGDGQVLPYIFGVVMGSAGGGLALTTFLLCICCFCSVSITVAASRCTWAFARDQGIPLSRLWAKVDKRLDAPVFAIALTTFVEMLLGLINLGNSSAFLSFVSVGVISLAVSYAIPIALSLYYKRSEVNAAAWTCRKQCGTLINIIALAWIAFQVVLFSMPTVLPTSAGSMNYAIVVFTGLTAASTFYYSFYARKHYTGPQVLPA